MDTECDKRFRFGPVSDEAKGRPLMAGNLGLAASAPLRAFGDQTGDQIAKQAAKPWPSTSAIGEGAANDTISTSTWTFDTNNADSALVKSTPTKTDTTTTIWLSAGTSGVIYGIRNTIVTNGSRTFERTAKITVRNA